MAKNPLLTTEGFGLPYQARVALSDSLHVMNQSAAGFKLMLRMMKTPSESQLLSFLRKVKKLLSGIGVGESLLLPAYVEARELIILLERSSERVFKVVVVQTDARAGLRHHSTTPVEFMPEIRYRTCMVLNAVPKKNVLDDVFWMALYNMAINTHAGDTDRFYDVLIPFLTGKPLEASLVEAEAAAAHAAISVTSDDDGSTTNPTFSSAISASTESKEEEAGPAAALKNSTASATARNAAAVAAIAHAPILCGEWRLPQRSDTAYVRCTFEAFTYLLRCRGVNPVQARLIHLCLCCEMVRMMQNDLSHVLPEQNGICVCSLAIKELSHFAVQVVDEVQDTARTAAGTSAITTAEGSVGSGPGLVDTSLILDEVYTLVESAEKSLSFCRNDDAELPPTLDLTGAAAREDPNDPALTQFRDHPLWDVLNTDSDPGQAVALQKYVPVDMLLIPQKANTRSEAITAIRMCDRLCSLLENQEHCIKNKKFLIAAAIEHLLTQVVPVPKPRGVGLSEQELYRSGRSGRRAARKAEEEKRLAAEKKKKMEEREKAAAVSSTSSKKSRVMKKAQQQGSDSIGVTLEAKGNSTEPIKFFGEQVRPDFDAGQEVEKQMSDEPCIWDEPIHYELQVELQLTLQRLAEHFASAAMSLVQSRSFDATCIIVSGCLAALSDALMRQIAVDEPSEMCSHLMGKTVTGRQLGKN